MISVDLMRGEIGLAIRFDWFFGAETKWIDLTIELLVVRISVDIYRKITP